MTEQRGRGSDGAPSTAGPEVSVGRSPPSRRAVLRSAAAIAAGGLAGCTGPSVAGGVGSRTPPAVSMLAAGSLNNALEHGLRPALDVPLRVEAYGSAALARMVAEGQKDPDVVSVSDVALFSDPLRPAWYAEFATNSVVVAYDSGSEAGQRIAEADRWFEALLADDVSVGRTDPDVDPLGYRTLFVLELAAAYYGVPGLRGRLLEPDQVYPETQLVSQFETGSIDAAFAYRNMAEERGYDYVDLPDEIDLSDPRYADRYARASYTLPGGTVVRGGVISYASTLRHVRPASVEAFEAHVSGEYLSDFGFVVPDDYPRYAGEVPDALA